LIYIKI